jgi:hypothetical protein
LGILVAVLHGENLRGHLIERRVLADAIIQPLLELRIEELELLIRRAADDGRAPEIGEVVGRVLGVQIGLGGVPVLVGPRICLVGEIKNLEQLGNSAREVETEPAQEDGVLGHRTGFRAQFLPAPLQVAVDPLAEVQDLLLVLRRGCVLSPPTAWQERCRHDAKEDDCQWPEVHRHGLRRVNAVDANPI